MADTGWRLEGEWFETCNCEYLCPCIITHMRARPTEGECIVAGVYHVEEGRFGALPLDGLSFVTVIRTPGPMAEGNWTVGAIIDERADDAQRAALTAIVSGKAGGPPDRLNALMGEFAGVEFAPIVFASAGLGRSVAVPGLLDQAVEGVASMSRPGEPIVLSTTLPTRRVRVSRWARPCAATSMRSPEMGRRQRQQQRPFHPLLLAELGHAKAGRPRSRLGSTRGFGAGPGCDTSRPCRSDHSKSARMANQIGRPVRRREDGRLLTGRGRFSDDFSVAGQVHAVLVRSVHPHARIDGVDASAALGMEGVLGVLTGADCAADGLGEIPARRAALDGSRSQAARSRRDGGLRRPPRAAAGRSGALCRRAPGHGDRAHPGRGPPMRPMRSGSPARPCLR